MEPKWEPKWSQNQSRYRFFQEVKNRLNHGRVVELLKVGPSKTELFRSQDPHKTCQKNTKYHPKMPKKGGKKQLQNIG